MGGGPLMKCQHCSGQVAGQIQVTENHEQLRVWACLQCGRAGQPPQSLRQLAGIRGDNRARNSWRHRDRRRDGGLCTLQLKGCTQKVEPPGGVCPPCRDGGNARTRSRYQRRRDGGFCVRCPQPPKKARPGRVRCDDCGRDHAARTTARNRQNKAQ